MYAFTTCCVMCFTILEARVLVTDYNKLRNDIINEETTHSLGGEMTLSEKEIRANNIIMKWKHEEVDESFQNPQYFNFSKHYFEYKKYIETSKVYQVIKKMPKGAALHLHSSYTLDVDTLLQFTYEDHLYACFTYSDLQLQFSATVPERPCSVQWTLMSELRNRSGNVTQFDIYIKRFLTLYDHHELTDSNINRIWTVFEKLHKTIKGLISYRPIKEIYIYKTLEKFYADNVMYLEIRSSLSPPYELDGTVHDKAYTTELYRNVTQKFTEEHPDFIGLKVILSTNRGISNERLKETIEEAKKLKAEYPDIIAGFDLVGQEDLGRPLAEYQPILAEVKDELNFYFHSGETNWFGTATDENLIDAILLGTKRIGHGFALVKHPGLLNFVKQRDIAIEVNVISNTVLGLVRDVRNHPLATYLALGAPVVLSSDDPGAWEADPLSYDFYVAFVGVANKNFDLRLLKQLAINSIKYSALENTRKINLLRVFYNQWNRFIEDVNANN